MERTKSINDAIRRNKLKVFNTSTPRSVSKGKQQLASLRNDVVLFSRLYISCQTRDGNLEEYFRHENQACPPALSDGESLHLGTKSDLLKCFEGFSSAQSEVPDTTCLVLDGAVIVQMLKPAVAKNFDDYAQDVFIPYLSSKLQTVSRLDLVWDRYIADSLKGSARSKRGEGVRRRVVRTAAIPGNWQNSSEWTPTRLSCSSSYHKLSSHGLTRMTSSSFCYFNQFDTTSRVMYRHEIICAGNTV